MDLFQWDVLGELNATQDDLSWGERARRKILRLHLAKLNWPRFIYGPFRLLGNVLRVILISEENLNGTYRRENQL